MELKLVPEKLYFCAEKHLKIPEIAAFAAEVGDKLCGEAESQGMNILGPLEFLYLNSTGDLNHVLNLKIALPVEAMKPSDSDFFFIKSQPFPCLSVDFTGSMPNIGAAWQSLCEDAVKEGYDIANQEREIYKEWVAFDSDDNVTELQMGVVAKRIVD